MCYNGAMAPKRKADKKEEKKERVQIPEEMGGAAALSALASAAADEVYGVQFKDAPGPWFTGEMSENLFQMAGYAAAQTQQNTYIMRLYKEMFGDYMEKRRDTGKGSVLDKETTEGIKMCILAATLFSLNPPFAEKILELYEKAPTELDTEVARIQEQDRQRGLLREAIENLRNESTTLAEMAEEADKVAKRKMAAKKKVVKKTAKKRQKGK